MWGNIKNKGEIKMKKIKYSSMYGKFGDNKKDIEPMNNIIMQKTTISIDNNVYY